MVEGSGTGANSCSRVPSATQTFPTESTATPVGLPLNCPFPLPELPNWVRNTPALLNSSMRLFPASTTQTFPDESSVTSQGELTYPFPLP